MNFVETFDKTFWVRVQKQPFYSKPRNNFRLSLIKIISFWYHLARIKQRFVCCHYLQINRLFELKSLIKPPDVLAYYNRLICRKLVKLSSLVDDCSTECLIGSCWISWKRYSWRIGGLDCASGSFVFTGTTLLQFVCH